MRNLYVIETEPDYFVIKLFYTCTNVSREEMKYKLVWLQTIKRYSTSKQNFHVFWPSFAHIAKNSKMTLLVFFYFTKGLFFWQNKGHIEIIWPKQFYKWPKMK